MSGVPLSLPEREEISLALIEDPDVSWASITWRIDRRPITIAREVTDHRGSSEVPASGR